MRKHVLELMPEDVKVAVGQALNDLYYGPSYDEEAASYTENLRIIRDWIDSDMPRTLWYDEQSGYVEDQEPEGYEDEEGEYVEPFWEDYRKYETDDIKSLVFGALVTDGGL